MTTTLVSLNATLIVKGESAGELLEKYDGLIASDGLHIVTINGRKLICECADSEFTEIIEFTENEEELLVKSNKADIMYYPSDNNVFKLSDMIRLHGIGDYVIVVNPRFSFLFDTSKQEMIEMDKVIDLDGVRQYLLTNYPDYQVLRKIKELK